MSASMSINTIIQMLDFEKTRRNEKVYNNRGGRVHDFDIFSNLN